MIDYITFLGFVGKLKGITFRKDHWASHWIEFGENDGIMDDYETTGEKIKVILLNGEFSWLD